MKASWIVTVLAISHSTLAEDLVMAPEELSHCVTCHGVELAGNRSVDSPNLSVLQSWYVESQLLAFAKRWRGQAEDIHGMEMQPMAAALDDAERRAAVDFVTSVPANGATAVIVGDVAAGELLYAPCAACHGAAGEGNAELKAPRLAGQSDWYLVRQLQNYKTGVRGTAAGDYLGVQMRAASETLAGENEILHVVAYINSLSTR